MNKWRPDGWEDILGEVLEQRGHCKCYKDAELGADAMLQALRKAGQHVENILIANGPGKAPTFQTGTIIGFIPDDSEGGA